jgi:hypothetical protein
MESNRYVTVLSMLVLTCLALPSQAADRMRAGQWVGSTIVGGKTYPTSNCMSKSDADQMNGDAKAVEVYLRKIIPPEACKITGVKVDGQQVTYTASCGGRAPKVVTTAYQGDSFEGTDSTGAKTEGKLVGACK